MIDITKLFRIKQYLKRIDNYFVCDKIRLTVIAGELSYFLQPKLLYVPVDSKDQRLATDLIHQFEDVVVVRMVF